MMSTELPQLSILVAHFPQRRGRRFIKSLLFMAHTMQPISKQLTVALPAQSRVFDRLVHRLPTEISEPCFDAPARNRDNHRIFRLSPLDSNLAALLLQLRVPVSGRTDICVNDDDQQRPLPPPDSLELLRKASSNPLLSRLPSIGKWTCDDVSTLDVPARQKSTYENIRLQVLAKHDHFRAHSSHPLAIASESGNPPVEVFGSLPTRTGPSPSRENHLPLAPAK